MSALEKVQVANTTLPIVEYQGQRVVTFAMIDQIHSRPAGTAKRNFQDNKSRMKSGVDFYLVDFSEKNEFRTFGIDVPTRGLTILTETGYLMLVKSFTDDLAWEVQRQLVTVYFRVKQQAEQKSKLHKAGGKPMTMAVIHSTFKHLVKMQRDFCKEVDLPHALTAAQEVMWKEFGVDMTRLIPGLAVTADQEPVRIPRADEDLVKLDAVQVVETKVSPEAELLPSDLGALLGGYTGIAFNKLLYGLGYQEPCRTRGKLEWHPTEKGTPFAVKKFVPRTNGRGADVPQLLWKAGLLDALRMDPGVQGNIGSARH